MSLHLFGINWPNAIILDVAEFYWLNFTDWQEAVSWLTCFAFAFAKHGFEIRNQLITPLVIKFGLTRFEQTQTSQVIILQHLLNEEGEQKSMFCFCTVCKLLMSTWKLCLVATISGLFVGIGRGNYMTCVKLLLHSLFFCSILRLLSEPHCYCCQDYSWK